MMLSQLGTILTSISLWALRVYCSPVATTVLNKEFGRCFIVAGFLFRSPLLAVSNGVVWVAGQVFPAINAGECFLEFCDCDDSDRVEICGVTIVMQHGHFK